MTCNTFSVNEVHLLLSPPLESSTFHLMS
jgi:hypothetical protein